MIKRWRRIFSQGFTLAWLLQCSVVKLIQMAILRAMGWRPIARVAILPYPGGSCLGQLNSWVGTIAQSYAFYNPGPAPGGGCQFLRDFNGPSNSPPGALPNGWYVSCSADDFGKYIQMSPAMIYITCCLS